MVYCVVPFVGVIIMLIIYLTGSQYFRDTDMAPPLENFTGSLEMPAGKKLYISQVISAGATWRETPNRALNVSSTSRLCCIYNNKSVAYGPLRIDVWSSNVSSLLNLYK